MVIFDSVCSAMYDLCVIGAGMIGSAAARHAAKVHGTKVCLIGPREPDQQEKTSREIFGAHYDESRITRSSDRDPVWATLAQRSIDRYRELERESGISFYHEVGCLTIRDRNGESFDDIKGTLVKGNTQSKHVVIDDINSKFPYLNFSASDRAVYEQFRAGHISPRWLVEAQLKLAQKQGCDVIDDVVSDVWSEEKDGELYMFVRTEKGDRFMCKKVLVATGSFTKFRNLLGLGRIPDMKLMPLTTARVEINEREAVRLKNMPSILYNGRGAPNWWRDFPRRSADNNYNWYMLPPVRYPDGKTYLKLGHTNKCVNEDFTTAQEMKHWYSTQSLSKLVHDTARLILTVTKGVEMQSLQGDHCVVSVTPSGRPYIDMVHAQLGVAIGGNGSSAKSSDEIGRMAAMMILKKWDSDIPKQVFEIQYKAANDTVSRL